MRIIKRFVTKQGGLYWRFENRKVDGTFPRNISDDFPGIPDELDAGSSLVIYTVRFQTLQSNNRFYLRVIEKKNDVGIKYGMLFIVSFCMVGRRKLVLFQG